VKKVSFNLIISTKRLVFLNHIRDWFKKALSGFISYKHKIYFTDKQQVTTAAKRLAPQTMAF
jgi:hypothetical protein